MTEDRSPRAPREPGYRGSLPPRGDQLARPWVLIVVALFLLIFVLSFVGLPSRLFPTPSPEPIPSFSLSPSPSFDLVPSVPASPGS
jgi:hypothetical protein